MSARYLPGETVDVMIKGAVVKDAAGDAILIEHQVFPHRNNNRALILLADAKVYRDTPADGVPAPGEVWADRNGALWFAQNGNPEIFLRPDNAYAAHRSWQSVHRDLGPLRLMWTPPADATPDGDR